MSFPLSSEPEGQTRCDSSSHACLLVGLLAHINLGVGRSDFEVKKSTWLSQAKTSLQSSCHASLFQDLSFQLWSSLAELDQEKSAWIATAQDKKWEGSAAFRPHAPREVEKSNPHSPQLYM